MLFIYQLFNMLIISIIIQIHCTNNVLNGEYKYNQRQSFKFNLHVLVIFSSILLPRFSLFRRSAWGYRLGLVKRKTDRGFSLLPSIYFGLVQYRCIYLRPKLRECLNLNQIEH